MYYLMEWGKTMGSKYGSYLLIMDDCCIGIDNTMGLKGKVHMILKQELLNTNSHHYTEGTIDTFNQLGIKDKDENLEALKERTLLDLL